MATGRTANGFGEVKEVDTGTVGGKGKVATPCKGEASRIADEGDVAEVSTKETEKPQDIQSRR